MIFPEFRVITFKLVAAFLCEWNVIVECTCVPKILMARFCKVSERPHAPSPLIARMNRGIVINVEIPAAENKAV